MESTPSQRVDVQVFPTFTGRVSKTWLRTVVNQALESCDNTEPLAISLVIADDETVRDLNLRYRGLDETTDVLAFPLRIPQEDGDLAGETFPLPPEETPPLGEVVISYPQAARQSREGKRPLKTELALLVVHGVLHLLGYDHAEPEEESRMWAKQEKALAGVPLK
ncbi:MAG: rRNA maturation factor [Dehalococcoidia bacterium]|nr:rRNA maturation factor [Dehalococcoidia bacterium]